MLPSSIQGNKMCVIAKHHVGHGDPKRILNAFNGRVCMQFEKAKHVIRLSMNINILRTMIKYLYHKWIKLHACYFVNKTEIFKGSEHANIKSYRTDENVCFFKSSTFTQKSSYFKIKDNFCEKKIYTVKSGM